MYVVTLYYELSNVFMKPYAIFHPQLFSWFSQTDKRGMAFFVTKEASNKWADPYIWERSFPKPD